jgi:hypothetical protein
MADAVRRSPKLLSALLPFPERMATSEGNPIFGILPYPKHNKYFRSRGASVVGIPASMRSSRSALSSPGALPCSETFSYTGFRSATKCHFLNTRASSTSHSPRAHVGGRPNSHQLNAGITVDERLQSVLAVVAKETAVPYSLPGPK